MKKIGTLTSAIALIFLGVWMIIFKNNPILAETIFKFWPVIFILLGVEILMLQNKKYDNKKLRINYWIIPIIILFAVTNILVSVRNGFGDIKNNIKYENGIYINFGNNSKEIEASKILDSYGEELKLEIKNGDIKIEKSKDENIIVDAKVYVDKNKDIDDYEIRTEKKEDGYKIDFQQRYVNGVKVTLYVPDGLYVKIDGDNLQIKALDETLKSNIDVDINNGNVLLIGDIEKANINISNGNVELTNKLCKEIKIDINNGRVDIDTEDKNVDIDVDVDLGVCKINSEKKLNGIRKTLGNGEGKIEIDLDNGMVNIDTQE